MLIRRHFWDALLQKAWKERSIIWLMGVRRVGKTSLCHGIEGIEYFDCEYPRARQLLAQPEGFLDNHCGNVIALDEIHKLDDRSESRF